MSGVKTIYEDESVLVINKPSGLVVNISRTTRGETLQNLICETASVTAPVSAEYDRGRESAENLEAEFDSRSGIVHRLDKDTSGVLVVAKTPKSFEFIKNQFAARSVKKEYIAVICGDLKDAVLEINAPIKRNPQYPIKFAVVRGGKEAFTRVEKEQTIAKEDSFFTRVRIFPKTGRSHQIRVHLSAISHPVAADIVYCTKQQYQTSSKYFSRLMLHAHKITLTHPQRNKQVTYEAEIPLEFYDE